MIAKNRYIVSRTLWAQLQTEPWAKCVATEVEQSVSPQKLSKVCRHRSWAKCVATEIEQSVSPQKLSNVCRHRSWAKCTSTAAEHSVATDTDQGLSPQQYSRHSYDQPAIIHKSHNLIPNTQDI